MHASDFDIPCGPTSRHGFGPGDEDPAVYVPAVPDAQQEAPSAPRDDGSPGRSRGGGGLVNHCDEEVPRG